MLLTDSRGPVTIRNTEKTDMTNKMWIVALAGLMMSLSAKAADVVQFGFWEGSRITYDPATHKGFVEQDQGDNNFKFVTHKKRHANFLACATGPKSKYTVYLLGKEENGENVVTNTFICVGEISGGTCSKKKTSCP